MTDEMRKHLEEWHKRPDGTGQDCYNYQPMSGIKFGHIYSRKGMCGGNCENWKPRGTCGHCQNWAAAPTRCAVCNAELRPAPSLAAPLPLGPHPFKKGDWVGRRIPISYELNLDEVMNTRTTDRHEWMEGDGSWHPCPGFVAYSVERVTR